MLDYSLFLSLLSTNLTQVKLVNPKDKDRDYIKKLA